MMCGTQSSHVTITYKFSSPDILNTCHFWNSFSFSFLPLHPLYPHSCLWNVPLFQSHNGPSIKYMVCKALTNFKLSLMSYFTFMSMTSSFETPIDIFIYMGVFNSESHCRLSKHKVRRVIPFVFVSRWTETVGFKYMWENRWKNKSIQMVFRFLCSCLALESMPQQLEWHVSHLFHW